MFINQFMKNGANISGLDKQCGYLFGPFTRSEVRVLLLNNVISIDLFVSRSALRRVELAPRVF